MSMIRRLLLSTSIPALLLACAARPELSQAKPPLAEPAPSFDIEAALRAERQAEPPLLNPYAPVRTENAARYSWQSDKHAACPPEASASNAESEATMARSLFAALPDRPADAPPQRASVNPDLVVASLRPLLHLCFSRWLDTRLDAQGSVRFALELGCDGDVAAISAENQGVDESTLECLFSVVAPAHFAPPTNGHATVLVPVVFKNAAR